MFLVEKIIFLKKVALFADMSSDELLAIAQISREESYASGTVVFNEGDPGDKMYLIASGKIDLSKRSDGSSARIASLSSGSCFGEMAILTDAGRTLTAVAAEPSVLLSICKEDFKTIVEEVPSVPFQIFNVLCQRLRSML
ncbi:MAG TPA: cyclic nucleotide-binding domain-containing protein [bacterium]|nr:cyclic nucleotide-binding domain-containing protein [bacterium]